MLIFIRKTYYHHGSFMVIHGFHGASQMSPKVAAVTKIQSVHRATQIRIIYHEVVAAVRGLGRNSNGEECDDYSQQYLLITVNCSELE